MYKSLLIFLYLLTYFAVVLPLQANISKISLKVIPKRVELRSNDYSEILYCLKSAQLQVLVNLYPGNYKIESDIVSLLEVSPNTCFSGKIEFVGGERGRREDGRLWMEPELLRYDLSFNNAVVLEKSGVKLAIRQICSDNSGKMNISGHIPLGQMITKGITSLLNPQSSTGEDRPFSQLVRQVVIQSSDFYLNSGEFKRNVRGKQNLTLQIKDPSIIHIQNFVIDVLSEYAKGSFVADFNVGEGTCFQSKDAELRIDQGGCGRFSLGGNLEFAKRSFSYGLSREENSLNLISLKNARFEFFKKHRSKLEFEELKLNLTQILYQDDQEQQNVRSEVELQSYAQQSRGYFPIPGGSLEIGKLTIPHLKISSKILPQGASFHCLMEQGILAECVTWKQINSRNKLELQNASFSTPKIEVSTWKQVTLNIPQFSVAPHRILYEEIGKYSMEMIASENLCFVMSAPLRITSEENIVPITLNIQGQIPRFKLQQPPHLMELSNIQLKNLQFKIQDSINVEGSIEFLVSEIPDFPNVLAGAQILIRQFNLIVDQAKNLQIMISLELHLKKSKLEELLYQNLPDRFDVASHTIAKRIIPEVVRNCETRYVYVEGFRKMSLEFGDNCILTSGRLTAHGAIYVERRDVVLKWPPKIRWVWNKLISGSGQVDVQAKILPSLVGSERLIEKKLQVEVQCSHIHIVDVPDFLQHEIRFHGMSLSKFIQSKISRTMEKDIFNQCNERERKELSRIYIQKLSFTTVADKVVFSLSGIFRLQQ